MKKQLHTAIAVIALLLFCGLSFIPQQASAQSKATKKVGPIKKAQPKKDTPNVIVKVDTPKTITKPVSPEKPLPIEVRISKLIFPDSAVSNSIAIANGSEANFLIKGISDEDSLVSIKRSLELLKDDKDVQVGNYPKKSKERQIINSQIRRIEQYLETVGERIIWVKAHRSMIKIERKRGKSRDDE